jgi:uroporphyrinogen decarboxylase
VNLQDEVNGISNIKRLLKGRVAIDLDIDRQNITMNGTPSEIKEHIHRIVEELGSKEGGLSLKTDLNSCFLFVFYSNKLLRNELGDFK